MRTSRVGATTSTFLACIVAAVASAAVAKDEPSPLCTPPSEWLSTKPPPASETTVPAPRPATDCAFYGPAWHRFLLVTQPNGTSPAFLSSPYVTFDALFPTTDAEPASKVLSLSPRTLQIPNKLRDNQTDLLSDISQATEAGLGGVLIDQRGNPIYYAIHVNAAFADFLKQHNLTTPDGIRHLDKNLAFPADGKQPSVMELKSAWMIVKDQQSAPTYFVVPAKVPHYVVVDGNVIPERNPVTHKIVPRDVMVALLAIHVVFTLPGHPEMIWSTFEHVHLDAKGKSVRDNAPAAASNPSTTPTSTVISKTNFPLYKAGTQAADANHKTDMTTMSMHFDVATQTFSKGGLLQTSVYRPYPGSKTDPDPKEDDEVMLMNDNMTAALKKAHLPASDMRVNYRLVGAVWINHPLDGNGKPGDFTVGSPFDDPIDQSTDDAASVLAGEGRLGSTAMESFTEMEKQNPHCFSCHDTNDVKNLPAALLNVSHILSKYFEQHKGSAQ